MVVVPRTTNHDHASPPLRRSRHEGALGSIMAHTDVYLQRPTIKREISICSKLLQERSGSISLAELSASQPSEKMCTISLFSERSSRSQCYYRVYLCPYIFRLFVSDSSGERLHSQQHGNHLVLSPTGVKQMGDIIRDAMHGITLVDAIGNRIKIPMEWCRTYSVRHAGYVLDRVFC
jgi:hypothetical protein